MLIIFKSIRDNKQSFLTAETGKQFEDRIEAKLRETEYTKLLKSDIDKKDFKLIKEFILKKEESKFLLFDEYPKTFIREPLGSQNYPDFLIFNGRYVIPIEIKYSKEKQSKPTWNSGIPRANGFYIFGSYKNRDITFFSGKSILSKERRKSLINFFSEVRKDEKKFSDFARTLPDKEKRGFMPYVRIAYQQQKINSDTQLNYFTHSDREKIEKEVFDILIVLE